MKNLLFLFATLLTLFSCNKDDDKSPIDQLPPATQTGANTAGCLINGEAFLPKGTSLGGPTLSCFYQRNQDGYHFSISIDNNQDKPIRGITLSTNGIELQNNSVVELKKIELDINNNFISNHAFYDIGGGLIDTYDTTDTFTGELIISYINTQLKIISGTFSFNAVNGKNQLMSVTDGRFDMHYIN